MSYRNKIEVDSMVAATRVQLEIQEPNQNIIIAPNLKYSCFKIESITVPHIWNYIPSGDVVFTDSLGVVTTIPDGNNQPSIANFALFAALLTSIDTGGATYTFNLDTTTMTYTLTGSAPYGITFDKWVAQHAGITTEVTPGRFGISGATVLQGNHFFFGTQMLLLRTGLTAVGQGTTEDNYTEPMSVKTSQVSQSNYIINLPVKSAIGMLETFYIGDLSPKYHMGQNPMTLNIQLTDEFGLLIDVRPQRWYLTIIYYN